MGCNITRVWELESDWNRVGPNHLVAAEHNPLSISGLDEALEYAVKLGARHAPIVSGYVYKNLRAIFRRTLPSVLARLKKTDSTPALHINTLNQYVNSNFVPENTLSYFNVYGQSLLVWNVPGLARFLLTEQ